MTWIDLGNPIPLDIPQRYERFRWPTQDIEFLTVPAQLELPTLDKVIFSRRTRHTFGSLTRAQISQFLWLSCRTIAKGNECLGFPITQQPAPSAGAIHPIHIVLGEQNKDWKRYDPDQHALTKLDELAQNRLAGLWDSIGHVVLYGNGAALLFIAEPGMTYAKYDFGNSLVWRDSGVLIGHMALLAEALQLNFCPLGITGEPWISNLEVQHQLVGVGIALLGSRGNV